MPRYTFPVISASGERTEDTSGVILSGDEAAITYAKQSISLLKSDQGKEALLGSVMEVYEEGRLVRCVPFTQLN